MRRFVLYHGKRHPRGMGAPEVEVFLTHLAVVGKVSASTQNQAKSALLFLYREVLWIDLLWLTDIPSARLGKRLPMVRARSKASERRLRVVLCWQYVFPSTKRSVDPRSGVVRRHHGDGKMLQRAMKSAVRDADIAKPATSHTLRLLRVQSP